METRIRGVASFWSQETWDKWSKRVAPGLPPGKRVLAANHFLPRPLVDEYNLGSQTEGFVYTLAGDGEIGVHVVEWVP